MVPRSRTAPATPSGPFGPGRPGPAGALAALAAVPQPSDDEVRRRLAEVFSRPEFPPGGGSRNLLARLLDWIGGLFRWLSGLHQTAPPLYWLLLVGCLVLLALLVTHIAWT